MPKFFKQLLLRIILKESQRFLKEYHNFKREDKFFVLQRIFQKSIPFTSQISQEHFFVRQGFLYNQKKGTIYSKKGILLILQEFLENIIRDIDIYDTSKTDITDKIAVAADTDTDIANKTDYSRYLIIIIIVIIITFPQKILIFPIYRQPVFSDTDIYSRNFSRYDNIDTLLYVCILLWLLSGWYEIFVF
eukprot:TRINITY_DN2744_c0_g1_i11.p2 TRINITY_DN2744_c0_g1~~TRINITY_DN2744_c0_g1_i11.p2  ORF type:complete len:190 (-),score=-15.56 TRINITY_DN2744_c0_g1_i11:434-1003(-)